MLFCKNECPFAPSSASNSALDKFGFGNYSSVCNQALATISNSHRAYLARACLNCNNPLKRPIVGIWLLVGAVGCHAPNKRRAPNDSIGQAGAGRAARPDSGRIAVTGPTLVVFFRGAYAVVDSGGDAAEMLNDLQYHLGSARPVLDSLEVAVYERYGDGIEYVLDGANRRFAPLPDSGRAAYLFLEPGAQPRVHYGVLTYIDLVDTARALHKTGRR